MTVALRSIFARYRRRSATFMNDFKWDIKKRSTKGMNGGRFLYYSKRQCFFFSFFAKVVARHTFFFSSRICHALLTTKITLNEASTYLNLYPQCTIFEILTIHSEEYLNWFCWFASGVFFIKTIYNVWKSQ